MLSARTGSKTASIGSARETSNMLSKLPNEKGTYNTVWMLAYIGELKDVNTSLTHMHYITILNTKHMQGLSHIEC